MAMVSVVLVAAYMRIWGSDRLVWSKGWQPPGACAALTKRTGWTLPVAVHFYDDITINIVAAITITIVILAKAVLNRNSIFNYNNPTKKLAMMMMM